MFILPLLICFIPALVDSFNTQISNSAVPKNSILSSMIPSRNLSNPSFQERISKFLHLDDKTLTASQRQETMLFCQLLGMNCAQPTDCTFSFKGFARRGGDTDKHSDGWGVAFYEGRGIRTFLDPLPAAHSPMANYLTNYPIKTFNMLAHIRFATSGTVALENVHPFQREMWGIQWSFAHNGDVPRFTNYTELPWLGGGTPGQRLYNPVGDTDSEAVFCALLNFLKHKFDKLPTLSVLHDTLKNLCTEICQYDSLSSEGQHEPIFNFLLMCGEHVQFAYSWPGCRPGSQCWNGLHYVVREYPFQQAQLLDCDYSIDFSQLTTPEDRIAVIATAPLTKNEDWIEFKKGELILFDNGKPLFGVEEQNDAEYQGHGLQSKVLPPSTFMGAGI